MKHLRRLFSKFAGLFTATHTHSEIDRELATHLASLEDEFERKGMSPAEARRQAYISLGGLEQTRTTCREHRSLPLLESLWADILFGSRQLLKHKVTTAAAVLSLGLAIGACTTAFRLLDALYLRPLPVSDPTHLYEIRFDGVTFSGEPSSWDATSPVHLEKLQAAVQGQAQLIGISYPKNNDLTFSSDAEMEKATVLHVSGNMFTSFGLHPALGRLLTEDDDRVKGASPYAVISYQYWTSRFGRDPHILGRTFRMGTTLYQVIGVCEEKFTGTEPGTLPDIYLPLMMASYIDNSGAGMLRLYVRPKSVADINTIHDKMYSAYRAFEQERAKAWVNVIPKEFLAGYPHEKIVFVPAHSGISSLQNKYRTALLVLTILVALVLLIACANVGNLITAQAASRTREMALRISLGAGRLRLVRLVMVENTLLALLSTAIGIAFAIWAAPFVVSRINPPDNPAHLALSLDWRVAAFALLLTLGVTLLFGLAPALRASAVKPVSALKGGEDPHSRQRWMHLSIAAQIGLCFMVLFLASLFVQTLQQLQQKPLGFNAENILLLTGTTRQPQPAVAWDQITDRLRSTPGVESAALSSWAPLTGRVDNHLISVNGAPPSKVLARFQSISPGWLNTMKIPLLKGRDFRDSDAFPKVTIVSRQFAKQFFNGADPVGKYFVEAYSAPGQHSRVEIIGLTADSIYKDVHDDPLPIAYAPMHYETTAAPIEPISDAVFIIRTTADPLSLAETLRRQIQHDQSAIRINDISTQLDLVRQQTIRERLLASLASFFATIALFLAAIGLYGVLHYSVLQREREIGIRIALGAAGLNIARLVTLRVFLMVLLGAAAGVALGTASAKSIQTLLYGVKGSDPTTLLLPAAILLAAALLAALPTVLRATRIDPAILLRQQ
jgi:putative ABC transport system permease protein